MAASLLSRKGQLEWIEVGSDVDDDDDPVDDCSFRTRNMLRRALAAARCSAILNDEPNPSASLRPEGRKRPMLKTGACDRAPVDASTLYILADDHDTVIPVKRTNSPRLDLADTFLVINPGF